MPETPDRTKSSGARRIPTTSVRSLRPAGDPSARRFAIDAARLMRDRHCENVLMYDLRGISDVADFMLLGSGTSDRQIRAVASELGDLAGSHQQPRLGREADESARWIVLDFIDVIVHVFEAEARAYYDLEMLWGDAPLVRWEND